MGTPSSERDYLLAPFLALSVELTGFTRSQLEGTGMARRYLEALTGVVAPPVCFELVASNNSAKSVMASRFLAPLARNVIRMWYLGQWKALPPEWPETLPTALKQKQEKFKRTANDTDHVISAEAYREGLVWRTLGAHPMGAKQPGFGTWQWPP